MAAQVSFKTKVLNTIIQCAEQYNSFYVEKNHLIVSDAFKKKPYYIIQAEKDNFLHLTGVSTQLSASEFFEKAHDGSLAESDIQLITHGKSEKESKGTIRQKMKNLTSITAAVDDSCMVQEDFKRNAVLCTFASANTQCTVGFIATPRLTRPKSLLNGNLIEPAEAAPIKLALAKKRGEEKYDTLEVGSIDDLAKNLDSMRELLSQDLISQAEERLNREPENNAMKESESEETPVS